MIQPRSTRTRASPKYITGGMSMRCSPVLFWGLAGAGSLASRPVHSEDRALPHQPLDSVPARATARAHPSTRALPGSRALGTAAGAAEVTARAARAIAGRTTGDACGCASDGAAWPHDQQHRRRDLSPATGPSGARGPGAPRRRSMLRDRRFPAPARELLFRKPPAFRRLPRRRSATTGSAYCRSPTKSAPRSRTTPTTQRSIMRGCPPHARLTAHRKPSPEIE